MDRSTDQFEAARGERGMVMMVFTLPSYDVVFKLIKDRFSYTKKTTREQVMDRYRLVFRHDRVGRLVDAQEFEHLEFRKERFSEDLLKELLETCAETVSVDGGRVVIKHLYTERRVHPLNLFVREAPPEQVSDAVLDYGNAIKDLAAANIFPGDLLLKNFGVTRHGRVVCYDYDELTLLTECNVREFPKPSSADEELEAEPWFYVGENDFFPSELKTFLGFQGELRRLFESAHADLFTVEFWAGMQRRLARAEWADFFPYRKSRRLRP
jgi:isocitrate dehydrogenase kinase/phosphatase